MNMILNPVNRRFAIINDKLTLYGLTDSQKAEYKKELTFDNPAYASAQRYSRYSVTRIPPYLTYYQDKGDSFVVPVGCKIPEKFAVKDLRVYSTIPVPKFCLELRDTQREAAEAFISKNNSTTPCGCVQLNTGKGKSILGLYLASYYSCKTLIVVHKDDLVTGWKKDIALAFDGKVNPGLIKAKSRVVGDFITIATVQTLNRLSTEELEELYNTFSFIIQDEQHHCASTSFSLVNNFKARYRLGLTATPERADGLTHVLNLYFGGFCFQHTATAEDEDILPVRVVQKVVPVYFNPVCDVVRLNGKLLYRIKSLFAKKDEILKDSQVRLSEIPYSSRPKVQYQTIDDFVVRQAISLIIPDIVKEYRAGHSCVVFFTLKEHCRLYYDALKEFIPEDSMGLYYGDTADNQSILYKAESNRQFVTLTTYAKATEGTNVKQWEVEFLVSSINNGKNAEQAVGRIRRVKEGKLDKAIVYDYIYPQVYSFVSHSRTREDRYRKLFFEIESPSTQFGLFKRGYSSRI